MLKITRKEVFCVGSKVFGSIEQAETYQARDQIIELLLYTDLSRDDITNVLRILGQHKGLLEKFIKGLDCKKSIDSEIRKKIQASYMTGE